VESNIGVAVVVKESLQLEMMPRLDNALQMQNEIRQYELEHDDFQLLERFSIRGEAYSAGMHHGHCTCGQHSADTE